MWRTERVTGRTYLWAQWFPRAAQITPSIYDAADGGCAALTRPTKTGHVLRDGGCASLTRPTKTGHVLRDGGCAYAYPPYKTGHMLRNGGCAYPSYKTLHTIP